MEDAPLRHEVSDEDLLARTEPVDASKRQADDSSSSSGSSDGSDDDEPMMVGGSIDTDAFALLEGVAYGKVGLYLLNLLALLASECSQIFFFRTWILQT